MSGPDVNPADDARAFAVLLHPHPDYGGNRFHPFISAMYNRLPDISVSAIRFDFSSADTTEARDEVIAAIGDGVDRWPGLPVVLVAYSFGAGIAATVDDGTIAGWYLLAPPLFILKDAVIQDDIRPKAVVIPEHDQFSPPGVVSGELSKWRNTAFSTVPGVDHFLGPVESIVDGALTWIGGVLPS
jgi:uncharacterized protein